MVVVIPALRLAFVRLILLAGGRVLLAVRGTVVGVFCRLGSLGLPVAAGCRPGPPTANIKPAVVAANVGAVALRQRRLEPRAPFVGQKDNKLGVFGDEIAAHAQDL